ncbi:CaiB/BaiF CoA transferase family protein [Salinactinospora qingdaonensis]|uniref:CoA transferase n=1 Tax=Salinactinospora qingdaonensis TaxID=702744 RepID=A0ABP7FBJ5_9ACTN
MSAVDDDGDERRSEFFREARSDLRGPLSGVRVLDVTTVWSGPMATCVLADLGADVIRVEMPGNRADRLPPNIPGTGRSWFHETVNRNKRSIGLDLRAPESREVFLELLATADVMVENFRPGTLERWNLGYQQCRQVRPDLVLVSVSGWGQWGSEYRRGGYDPVVQAASGWMSLNGDPEGDPVRSPTFLADDVAGLHAAIGALAALRHRDQTGEGQHVDAAMMDALLFQSSGLLTLAATGVPLRRLGNRTEFLAPTGHYTCADGGVYLVIAQDRQWRTLIRLMGRPELAEAPGFATNRERLDNREEIDALVAEWCLKHDVADVVAQLGEAGLIVSPVRSFAEVAADPSVHERGMLQETELSNGTRAPLTGPAVKFSRTPTAVRSGAPDAGQHTEELLDEIGVDTQRRKILRSSGILS